MVGVWAQNLVLLTIRSHFTGIRNSLSLPGLLSVFELVGLDCV